MWSCVLKLLRLEKEKKMIFIFIYFTSFVSLIVLILHRRGLSRGDEHNVCEKRQNEVGNNVAIRKQEDI